MPTFEIHKIFDFFFFFFSRSYSSHSAKFVNLVFLCQRRALAVVVAVCKACLVHFSHLSDRTFLFLKLTLKGPHGF